MMHCRLSVIKKTNSYVMYNRSTAEKIYFDLLSFLFDMFCTELLVCYKSCEKV